MLELKRIKITHLQVWTEVVGTFCGFTSDSVYVYLKIDDILLLFPRESRESQSIVKKLGSKVVGQKVGLLRYDNSIQSLLVRIIHSEISSSLRIKKQL